MKILTDEFLKNKLIGWGWILSPAKEADMISQHKETVRLTIEEVCEKIEEYEVYTDKGWNGIEIHISVWQVLKDHLLKEARQGKPPRLCCDDDDPAAKFYKE